MTPAGIILATVLAACLIGLVAPACKMARQRPDKAFTRWTIDALKGGMRRMGRRLRL